MILGIGEYRDYETYLPKCKEITEQLGDMIRDILNASRLQTQGNNESCSNFSLRTLLTELCEPYRLIAEAKGIKFKIELSSDAFVYLPEGRLKKAISNILSNAVNYTEAGQSISVVFDKNKLSVSNECRVLPPEQLQHIFEPFYRPDLAHSQATGGNGLGLYIVQTILDKLRLKYQFVPMPNDILPSRKQTTSLMMNFPHGLKMKRKIFKSWSMLENGQKQKRQKHLSITMKSLNLF